MSDCSLAQGTVQNPIKIIVRGTLDTPITHIHDTTAHSPGMVQHFNEKCRG